MTDPIDERKRWLRSEYRRLRRSLSNEARQAESSATATLAKSCLRALDPQGRAAIASYMAMPDEIDLGELHAEIWQQRRPVWLPRIQGPGRLAWFPVRSLDDVRIGTLNLCEPDPELVAAAPLPESVICFVPGVAFSSAGGRLGLGGGYYDRILAGLTPGKGRAIGVGFTCQRCDDLPLHPHDRPVDAAILGGRVLHCRTELRQVLGW